jgi:hypothetical protein
LPVQLGLGGSEAVDRLVRALPGEHEVDQRVDDGRNRRGSPPEPSVAVRRLPFAA